MFETRTYARVIADLGEAARAMVLSGEWPPNEVTWNRLLALAAEAEDLC